jgi:hypothetical protein
MIAAIIAGCYALAALFAARVLYGRWRSELMALGSFEHYCNNCRTLRYALATDREAAMRAMAAAVAWPLTLLVFAVVFRPPPTATERAAAEAKLKSRIAELEKELGVQP